MLVTVALVMAAMMAASALPASAVPVSEMSCEQLAQEAEQTTLQLANALLGGNGNASALQNRLDVLGKEAERKGCGEYDRNPGGEMTLEIPG
jgi:hypothetical protein